MSLNFAGVPIPGFHERMQRELPVIHAERTHFCGLTGDSEITTGTGSRALACKMWLNDPSFGSAAAVENFLQTLDSLVETNGTLQLDSNRTFNDCTFEGYSDQGDILPAIGAGMSAGSYWVEITLHWRQLAIP